MVRSVENTFKGITGFPVNRGEYERSGQRDLVPAGTDLHEKLEALSLLGYNLSKGKWPKTVQTAAAECYDFAVQQLLYHFGYLQDEDEDSIPDKNIPEGLPILRSSRFF